MTGRRYLGPLCFNTAVRRGKPAILGHARSIMLRRDVDIFCSMWPGLRVLGAVALAHSVRFSVLPCLQKSQSALRVLARVFSTVSCPLLRTGSRHRTVQKTNPLGLGLVRPLPSTDVVAPYSLVMSSSKIE